MSEAEPRVVRCAIYTRKSTEEGLEQEFNTLRAQREAAEAYILSQRQAHWVALGERYDDGGCSGATLERPALARLLDAIERGEVDCVLVYKVDRLSRSLLDFARLMERFDQQGISFVSVTQDFNTTTSLGRLTLNILLSFAQFEREIIGERTRDKLGAARRKGKWIGGSPVLGYDVHPQGGRLVVNEKEAEQVREMFRIARDAGTLSAAWKQIVARGLRTKPWTSRGGRPHGGQAFSQLSVRLLLSNVLYTGSVSHKGTVYPGEHPAIVERELWAEVNRQLQIQGAHQRGRVHRQQDGLLLSLVYCGQCGGRMAMTYTSRDQKQYRYYVCRTAVGNGGATCSPGRVAAGDLDASVLRHLEPTLGRVADRALLEQALERVVCDGAAGRFTLHLRDGTRRECALPRSASGRRRIQSARSEDRGRVPRISRLMGLAIQLEAALKGTASPGQRAMAEVGHVSRARLSQILRLNDLAPEIQEQLLFLPKTVAGRDGMNEQALRKLAEVTDWDEQRQGFQALLDASDGR